VPIAAKIFIDPIALKTLKKFVTLVSSHYLVIFFMSTTIMGGIFGAKKKTVVGLVGLCAILGGLQHLYDYKGVFALIGILGPSILYFKASFSKSFWNGSFFDASQCVDA
jgi:hypothetical protein